jgi:Tfp pilus assembly protein PilO
MSETRTGWKWWRIDLIGLACCASLTAGGYLLTVVPVMQSGRHASQLRTKIENVELQTDRLVQLSRKLDLALSNIGARLTSNALTLEPAERANQRVTTLTRLASECGLTLDEVTPSDPEPAELYRTVPIRLTGKGSFTSSAMFLHRLRTELRDTTLRAINLTGDPTGETASTFVFELVWYAAPEVRADRQKGE